MRYVLSLLICALALPVSFPAVAILLLTSWDGRTTIFGNMLYGRGNTHYSHPTKGYWQEFLWLAYQNPINNLLRFFAVPRRNYTLTGDPKIGDQIGGGQYYIRMGGAWEYYRIIPYGSRCIRIRLGWKIQGKAPGEMCPLVFTINPLKPYSGAK